MAWLARRAVWLCVSLGMISGLACSDGSMHTDTGVLDTALTATTPSGNYYRLRNAIFHITGASSVDVTSEQDPGADSIHVQLVAGSYTITLDPGWYLERSRPGGTFERVDATLTSSASQTFAILAHQTTNVVYRFEVSGEIVEMSGDLVIGIDVEEPTCNGSGCPPPPCGTGPFLAMAHAGTTSTVRSVEQDLDPPAGERVFTLPPMTANLTITADGVLVATQIVGDPDVTETQARATIPSGTRTLRLSYDILDGSLPYEGRWYLRHPTSVAGPRQVCIDLPAGATVDRLDWPDTDPAPDRIVFQLSASDTEPPFVVYTTPEVPDLYDHIETPHFVVNIAQAHRPYQPAILGLLENLYTLYGQYTGQDVNQIQHQFRYPYSYPPTHWKWGGVIEIPGGLSVKGLSTVNALFVPQITLPTSNGSNFMVAISAHELGNGWWGTWEDPDPANRPPNWIDSEGHSGFLRGQGELDLGYCEDARREHASAYQDFLACTSECGGYIVLTSLRERYGWAPFRAYYAAIQSGSFNFRGMTEVERSSVVIQFFSEQVGQNLVPFFDAAHIAMTQAVRDELARRFPPADVTILSDLTCRPAQLRVAGPVTADVSDNAATGQAMGFACAPGGWTATLVSPGPGLTLTVPATRNCGTATIDADLAQTGFGQLAQLQFEAPGLPGSPATVPVTFTPLHDILHGGSFEPPLAPDWVEVEFLPTASFTLDAEAPHGGHSALRIDAPEDNDARLVQTVTVQPNTHYRLSGWIRTAGVADGLGANLTIEWPGQGWQNTRGILGTSGWTFVAIDVDAGTSTSFQVQARLGHYGAISRGRAWFDDLRLELVP